LASKYLLAKGVLTLALQMRLEAVEQV